MPAQRGVYVQAPKSDIYVALLGVALGAMVLACLLLVLLLKSYDFSTKVSTRLPASSSPVLVGTRLTDAPTYLAVRS